MLSFVGSRRIAFAILAGGVTASAAAGQARVERIIGAPAGAVVQRAGESGTEAATAGAVLQPGDALRTDANTQVALRCTTPGAPVYRLDGGFHGYIDVPVNGRCSVAVAEGHADVIAEDTTHTVGGKIPLASKGTQYSVDVTREGRSFTCKVAVFEGEVFSPRGRDESAAQGSIIQWTRGAVTKDVLRAAEIERSAALYATFDVAAARAASPQTAPSYEQLKSLHYEVLAHPTDTVKRVELAKRQIQYKVDDQAAYNLRRAKVTNDSAMRRYQIDPRTIRDNPALRDNIYRSAVVRPEAMTRPAAQPQPSRASPRAGAARVTTAYPAPTTDSDLQLIRDGRIDEAIRNLEARVATPNATSRDQYALARAYDGRDAAKVRAHASQAVKLHATDGKLSDAELEDVRELLSSAV